MPESTDLEVRRDVAAMTDEELKRTFSIAKALALSKRFPDARTADEAFAKILVGRDLGLSPTQALTGLHIVEGRPQIAAVTLAGFVRKSDRYDYTIDEHTAEKCTILFWVDGDEGGRSTFTIEEAKTAGLVKDKSNWVKWPKNMLFARAMSNGVKWYCPDLMGGVPIYTEADVFEGTASELTAGEGSGEPVGWKGISVEHAKALEGILEGAENLGHAGLANRATTEMAVNGQSARFVEGYIGAANHTLQQMQEKRDQETADVILDAAETPANGAAFITWENFPDTNERIYRHPGCDGRGARWMVPLDDCPQPREGETDECANCAAVLPVVPAEVPADDPERIAGLNQRRDQLLDEISAAEPFMTQDLRNELAAIEAELGGKIDPGQEAMDV